MLRTKFFTLTSVIVLIALMLGACGTPATPTTAPEPTSIPATTAPEPTQAQAEPTTESETGTPMVDPSTVEGDIITAGSSTVFPLSERMSELFQQEGYSGNLTVDSIGTGAGFERFCKTGETDVSNASRAIKPEETEACQAIGREPLEFRVGTDALAVVVSADNTFVDSLTKEQLKQIFSGEAKTWQDINADWPADAIQVYSPGTDSGTFDYFVEAILNKEKDLLLNVAGAQFSEDDNVLAQGVEGSPNAIGYFGYAYFAHAQGKLKAVPIESISPSQETVDDGSYPLSRPLFIYSDPKIMAEKPQVAAFIGFYLQHVNDEILEVGYFPAPDQAYEAALATWMANWKS
jgi:phosphate transport system substrate-binding protein